MAASNMADASPQMINQLLQKLTDNDPDFRFMALNDLLQVLENSKPQLLQHDYNTAARTVDHLVRALDDNNGEVQNQAIKCLGPMVHKLPSQIIGPLMEKLSTLKLKNSVDNAVPALALKSVIEALPRPAAGVTPTKEVADAYAGVSRVLIPRLLGRNTQALQAGGAQTRLPTSGEGLVDRDHETSTEIVDVLIEVVRCFGPMLQPVEVEALQDTVVNLLEKDRSSSVVKKRAVVATSILAAYFSDELLGSFVERSVAFLGDTKTSAVNRRLYITILGSMARSIPFRFGHRLGDVVPHVLAALSEEELQAHAEEDGDMTEFNEVREAALVALEAFLASCPNQMRPYTDESLGAILRYLKYDPNYAFDEDEEMDEEDEEEEEDDDFDGDDDFDMDEGFDDDDDASWKVRRCAAKAMHTLISTRSSGDLLEDGILYDQAAPALIKRFDEREENVRLEVISAMSLLVRKTGEGVIPEFSLDNAQGDYLNQLPASRKRRRQSSGGGVAIISGPAVLTGTGLTSPTMERIPATGPRADLAEKTPAIIKAATKLLKGKLIPTKQAVVNLLDDIVTVQQGGLGDYLEQLIGPIIEAIKPSSGSGAAATLSATGGNASATLGTLRIAALRLTSRIAKTHSSQLLQPHLSKVVAGVLSAVSDRFYKISGEAIQTLEELIKAITPPRSRMTAAKFKTDLLKMYDVAIDRTTATDIDTEVRQKAIHALGTLLSRTCTAEGASLLAAEKRREALGFLLERLKNETTRLAAVRAIETISSAVSANVQFEPEWVRPVAVELANQLRKANRALRGSSIQALRYLVHSPASKGSLDDGTVRALVSTLQPVITNNDAHLLGPALLIMADLIQENAKLAVTPEIISALCEVLRSNVAGTVLDSLLHLVTSIGQNGAGEPLMAGLLKNVGIEGDPVVVGKVIGNLLVASGGSAGVTIDSFTSEVQNNRGDQLRASLALAVLGEVGLRLGAKSPIKPELFLGQLGNSLDKVALSAAVALGRAGAGDVSHYLPVILDNMSKDSRTQYLLLHSVKETLQQVTTSRADVDAFMAPIWEKLLQSAGAEDNKAVCAECIGRMTIISPQIYIPKLQGLLGETDPALRGIAVQALRYCLPEGGDTFDTVLKEHLVNMLNAMLNDQDMEIRRLAMTALNSAAHNKPELILGHLGQLVPFVMLESKVKPELIREVQMGPFKHLVDDGLELRKGAYETLYALMETAFSRISIIDLYDRIVDGLGDDNDIRALCNLMVSKLVVIAPEETTRRLDSIADKYRATLSTKLKDNAVKQDHEKQDEANKSVLRVTLLLSEQLRNSLNAAGATADIAANQRWAQYAEWVKKDFERQLKALRDENKELGGRAAP